MLVCDFIIAINIIQLLGVSILVLVDVGLRLVPMQFYMTLFTVSILVLVDVGLRPSSYWKLRLFDNDVSILVLVDVGLRLSKSFG